MQTVVSYNDAVFINCPFDEQYKPLLNAIVFTIYRCGFVPRTALNEDNALDNRLSKIEQCISNCRYGVHDISRTELNSNGLSRFNMPFELGIFFGARRFGNRMHKSRNALIFDVERYRYLEYISDLNGVDIKSHYNNPETVIRKVRNWLMIASGRTTMRGYNFIINEYLLFIKSLPLSVNRLGLDINKLFFNDYCLIVEESIKGAM